MTHLIDPFTGAARLCGDDGVVRAGHPFHSGVDFACSGSAHPASGGHLRCTSPHHITGVDPVFASFATGGVIANPSGFVLVGERGLEVVTKWTAG